MTPETACKGATFQFPGFADPALVLATMKPLRQLNPAFAAVK